MTLSKEDLQAIADMVTRNVMQQINNTGKQEQQVQEQVAHVEQPKAHKKPQIRVQVQNRKPLTVPPTFKNLKQLKAEKEAEEQRLKEEKAQRKVKCIVCGEEFHPTSVANKVCPNKLCREINKYNGVIKKHIQERTLELAEEME
jgi:SMC interacting uncharacterized protein involved in chromosome segregation